MKDCLIQALVGKSAKYKQNHVLEHTAVTNVLKITKRRSGILLTVYFPRYSLHPDQRDAFPSLLWVRVPEFFYIFVLFQHFFNFVFHHPGTYSVDNL